MPGAYELQLISKYFGGPGVLRSMAAVRGAQLADEATSSSLRLQSSSDQHAHAHHLHTKRAPAAANKQMATEEELMQVLFNKLQGTKYAGPAHQGGSQGQPGH